MILDIKFHFADDSGAAGAKTLSICLQAVHPAAGTLLALGLGDTYGHSREVSAVLCGGVFGDVLPITGGNNEDLC